MKTKIIFAFLSYLLIMSCTQKDRKVPLLRALNTNPDTVNQFNPNKDSAILILSIPDWALGKLLTDSSQLACQHANDLHTLRGFDNALFVSLLENKKIGKHRFARKINPCCPCTSTQSSCCQCQGNMVFASPSTMQAKVTADSSPITPTTTEGVDLFVVPVGTQSLAVTGNALSSPMTFNMNQ
jgi:hypothetical protein